MSFHYPFLNHLRLIHPDTLETLERVYETSQLDGFKSVKNEPINQLIELATDGLGLESWWIKNNGWLLNDDSYGMLIKYYTGLIKTCLNLPRINERAFNKQDLKIIVYLNKFYRDEPEDLPLCMLDKVACITYEEFILCKKLKSQTLVLYQGIPLDNETRVMLLHDLLISLSDREQVSVSYGANVYDEFRQTYYNRRR